MKTAYSEQELAGLANRGEPAAMRMIYEKYIGQLTAVCSRYVVNEEDVKDVLQESFIKIFAAIGKFEYTGEGSLRAWLNKVVVNESLKFIRTNGRLDFTTLSEDVAGMPDDEPEITDVPASVIFGFIRQLPDGYRAIFNLYAIEGKSHREIAGMLNIKESTSASQLHRAKALLAAKIKEHLKKNLL